MKKILASLLIVSSLLLSTTAFAAYNEISTDLTTAVGTAFNTAFNDNTLDKNYFFVTNFIDQPNNTDYQKAVDKVYVRIKSTEKITINAAMYYDMSAFAGDEAKGVQPLGDDNSFSAEVSPEKNINFMIGETDGNSGVRVILGAVTPESKLPIGIALKDVDKLSEPVTITVELYGVKETEEMVVDSAEYTFKPLMSTEADGGYYTETEDADSTKKNGDVAFRTFFEKFADYDITKYGIYVYKTSTGTGTAIEGNTELTTSNGYYTGTVTDVPLNATVYAKPYAVIGEKTYYGEMVNTTLTEASKWLGVAKEAE